MSGDPEDVKAKLETLRQAFVNQLPDRIRELEKAWAKLDSEAWNFADFAEFHRGIHALAGSGAMFGCDVLSQRARLLDTLLKALASDGEPPSKGTKRLIRDGLRSMKEAVAP